MNHQEKNTAETQRTVKLNAFKGQRYIIVDPITEATIDDAQGFGFRTKSNAEAYADAQGWVVLNREVVESGPLF